MKKVTVIPATINRHTAAPINDVRKRRTAGYARVSTNQEEQLTSYEAQVDYYTNYIKSRDDWEFISVYTDDGISAGSTAKRAGFKKMVADALAGKLDLIVTKSVSRFARNTVDSLTTIRNLKEAGVEVYFEKENIWTFDSKGELLITIMSSLAQEELRSLSENCTWGQRKRIADGKVTVPYSRFLGYEKGEEDGILKIVESEAALVRRIYSMFLEGATFHKIAKALTAEKIPTPGNKETWSSSTIQSILTNEKMMGSALLQKTFTVNFLTKQKKLNEGEIPQYYVENSHPAIITPAVFEMVQQEIAKRKSSGKRHSGAGIFASKIKCGICGSWYGAKVWHSNSKYRRTIYQCNGKFKNAQRCDTPHFYEDDIKRPFVAAVNKLFADKDEIIANFDLIKQTIFDTAALETERSALRSEIAVISEMMQNLIGENARVALNQAEYNERYDGLAERYTTAETRLNAVAADIADKKSRCAAMEGFIAELRQQDGLITEFDEKLWHSLLDFVVVHGVGDVRFVFRDGTEIN